MTEQGKRGKPIFMISTEGKSAEQIKAEAHEALRRYREAQHNDDATNDSGSPGD